MGVEATLLPLKSALQWRRSSWRWERSCLLNCSLLTAPFSSAGKLNRGVCRDASGETLQFGSATRKLLPATTLHPPQMLFFVTCSAGSASQGSVSLKGRSCLTLKDFSSDEIKRLLWTSSDLKHRIKLEKQVAKRLYW